MQTHDLASAREASSKPSWNTIRSASGVTNKISASIAAIALIAALAGAMSMSGCASKTGMDRVIESSYDFKQLSEMLSAAKKEMSPADSEALVWALSDYKPQDILQKFANTDLRSFVRGEGQARLKKNTAKLNELIATKKSLDAQRENLSLISARDITMRLIKEPNGMYSWEVTANVTNASQFDVGNLIWNAELFIDDSPTPVANTIVYENYQNEYAPDTGHKQGLLSGNRVKTSISIRAFSTNDWFTNEVLQAKNRRLVLTPQSGSTRGLDGKQLIPPDPDDEIEAVKEDIVLAQRFSFI